MAEHLYKFTGAEGAIAILRFNSMFVTSPLDLNDPFEMRPAWTNDHEHRFRANQLMQGEMMGASPVLICTEGGGLVETGELLPPFESAPFIEVDSQRGISDEHNGSVFRNMHETYRVLSLVKGLIPEEGTAVEALKATLLWTHYADMFQGVCIAIDPAEFNNGLEAGGYAVNYAPGRRSLPPKEYDSFLRLPPTQPPHAGNVIDHSTGFELSPSEMAALAQHRYIDLLTHKSPAWKYENEVRMVYDLRTMKEAGCHKDVWQMCAKCNAMGNSLADCADRYHRDAVAVPENAIRAVIFGTDCQHGITAKILGVLAEERYQHIELFWCSLHSDKYEVQYNKTDAEYVRFIQEHRSSEVAFAKGHVRASGNGLEVKPSAKGVNYPHFASGS